MQYNSYKKLKHQNGAIRHDFAFSGWFTKNNNLLKT